MELKEHYQRGGLGDMAVKKYLLEELQAFLQPIRDKRIDLEKNKDYVLTILEKGTAEANIKANDTLKQVRKVMGLF